MDALALIDDVVAALSNGDLTEALYDVSQRVAEASGYSRCAVLVLPGDDPQTIYLVAASDDQVLTRLPLDLRKYPELRQAFETRAPVLVEESASSALLAEFAPLAAQFGGTTLLVIPLLVDRRPIGALLLRSPDRREPPSPTEMRALELCAGVVALPLREGRIEALREQTRRISLDDYNQKRRMRALEQYKDFFESAADGMVVVDGSGDVLYMNRAAEQITGYSHSGLAGRSLREIVSDSQREGLMEIVTQAAAGNHLAGFDLQLLTTSGEPLRVSVSTSTVLAEHGVVVLAFRDVTLARALEDELRKTKEFLERLIDSTVDAIIACDMRGRIIIFNQGAERLYGWSAQEVIGKLPVWRLYPDGEARRIMHRLRSPEHGGVGRLSSTRLEITPRDGQRVPVLLTASIIYEDGVEIASVGILSDLRERINIETRLAQTQQKLLETEKQALIADLAGTTAHELNQPLTSVMGYAELLKKRMGPDDPHVRAVDTIISEAERMAQIVRKIGKITRYETKAYVGSTTILDLDKSATEG